MRVTYDPEADAVYLYVGEGVIAETREVAPNVMIDLTETGELVGIELLAASRRPGTKPMALSCEVLGRSEAQPQAAA